MYSSEQHHAEGKDRVEFKPPQGFKPPEGEPEKEWEAVCTFKTKPDGMVCMTKLGETPLPGYDGKDHDEAKEEAPNYKGMAGQLAESMSGLGGGAGSMGAGPGSGY